MSKLFSTWQIAGLELPNRIIRSATWEGMADEKGFVTDKLIEFYRKLASGGTGLIILGYSYVRPDGKGLPGQTGIYQDAQIEGMAKIAEVIHQEGSKAFVQIVHAGGQTTSQVTGIERLIAPSYVFYPSHKSQPEAITLDELPELVADFADAARRTKEAGFDGVQIHAAHGYLLNCFLTPALNKREDEYGGSLKNRARMTSEVIRAVRREVGDDFPVAVKMNSKDFIEDGLELDEALLAAKIYIEAGLDFIEVSGGVPAACKLGSARDVKELSDEAYFRQNAKEFKNQFDIPIAVVGGIRSLSVASDIIKSGDADAIAMCRPLIRQPDLPFLWHIQKSSKADCISCKGCFKTGLAGGISCIHLED